MCAAKRHVCFTPDSDRECEIPQQAMSALPPKADMCSAVVHVCFGSIADIVAFIFTRLHSAARSPERRKRWILVSGRGRVKNTHVQRKSYPLRATNRNALSHSINWSARPISVLGTLRLSDLAVLRLITSSYLVGACTGRSAGFSPLRMRST